MNYVEGFEVYPNRRAARRPVVVGGMSKCELLVKLQGAKIELNEAGHALFAHEMFQTSSTLSTFETVEVTVTQLGFAAGATITEIHERAAELGLSPCPLELGPYLRLDYVDQPQAKAGTPPSHYRAPPGSLTVASLPIAADDDTPKGFYLRRIEGVLWLRGYRSWPGHLWSPEDNFVFCLPPNTA